MSTSPRRPTARRTARRWAHPHEPVIDLRTDAGELQRIWDLGEGPDTGPMAAVRAPLAPASTVPSPVPSGAGPPAATVPVAFLARPAASPRPRVGTTEARVHDALAHMDADELTRTLEGPSLRGRHAAEAVYDAPPRTGPTSATDRSRSIAPRKGRHAA